MTPAKRIIEKFGGAPQVAELLGLSLTQIYRWDYPPERGGAGGRVPGKHHQVLLDLAKDKGIHLEPADFFDVAA